MTTQRSTSLLLLALILLAAASTSRSQVVETPKGPVEFLGLRQWRFERLVDTLRAIDARRALDPANRVTAWTPYQWERSLLIDLDFPTVHVMYYPEPEGPSYWVVTVVEPADSSKIRLKPDASVPIEKAVPEPEWEGLDSVPLWQPELWQVAVGTFGYIASGNVEKGRQAIAYLLEQREKSGAEASFTLADVEHVWLRIAHLTRPDQKRLALKILATDSSVHNRAVAAAVLANFSHDDAVWRALLAAQLDQWWLVSATARKVLVGFGMHLARRIDWAPSQDVIRAMLDGSNVEGLADMLEVLEATEISPELAPFVLPGHEHLLLAYLAASHERERLAANRFLVRLAGGDRGGNDPAAWRKWIAGLGGGRE